MALASLSPTRTVAWDPTNKLGCPLVAVALGRGIDESKLRLLNEGAGFWNAVFSFIEEQTEGSLTYTYLVGYLHGWNGTSSPKASGPASYLQGVADGEAAWAA
ncbi:MAG: hypothetical protein KC492_29850 [Myxococcales bacterium]|nr:hypothetical protein [Myxococcales bacterium]